MKIAYCIDSVTAMGGIERITIAKANALADMEGYDIYILVAYHHIVPIFPLNPKIKLVVLDVDYGADYGKSPLQAWGIMVQKRKEYKRKLEKVVDEIMPDILISVNQSEKFSIKSLSLNYHPIIIREVHFCTEYRLLEPQNTFQLLVAKLRHWYDYRWNMKAIHRIVLLTEEDKERHWKNNPKAMVIPNPITDVPNVAHSETKEKRVIAAGRLVNQKNFASLIRAWKGVQAKHPDWKLDIYGEGSLKTSLEKLIADLQLEGAVCLQGKTQEIFKEMTNSSIFVLSSIYEGFGLVIVEAMSCGLPVVSYACPCGPKDIIEEGKDGFLVEVNDEQTLAARINQLIEDEELRRQMSQAALQKSEKYKMERIIPMWMDLFEKLKREKG